jgi:outer membrane lipoprotein-sorting protein
MIFLLLFSLCMPSPAFAASAKATPMAYLKKMEHQLFGKSFQASIEMQVKNGSGSRTLAAKIWQKGEEDALVKILEPAKDRNSGNLRIKFDLWQYLPNTDRIIKIPSSLMLQSWMGSDFTNDDLVRASRLSRDYTSKFIPSSDKNYVAIECLPKKDALVIWGKVVVKLRRTDAVPVSQEFFNERGVILKKMTGEKIKTFGSHTIPTFVTMASPRKGTSTTIEYQNVVFDENIPDSKFTQIQLKKPVF